MEKLKTNNEVSEQIDIALTKLFYLSLLINRYSKRCVFFDMQGHVSTISLRIVESKENYNYMPIRTEISFDNSKTYNWNSDSESRLRDINDKIDLLHSICIEDKIPYDWCVPIKTVTEYEY